MGALKTKDNDSTVHTTGYAAKEIQQLNPVCPTTEAQLHI